MNLKITILLLFLFLSIPGNVFADFYRYTDDKGVVCITNNLSNVPEKYRAKVIVIKEEKKVIEEVKKAGGWVEEGSQSAEDAVQKLVVTVSKYPYRKLGISFAIYAVCVVFLVLFLSRYLNRNMMTIVVFLVLTSGFVLYAFRLEVEETHRKFVKMKAHVEKVQKKLGKRAAAQAKAAQEVEEMLKDLN